MRRHALRSRRHARPSHAPRIVTGIRCVLPARALLGEGPLWDPEDRRLYWVDIKGRSVHRFDPATGQDTRWPAPETVGSLVRRAAGGLVVALRSGFHSLDLDTGAIRPIATPELDRLGQPLQRREARPARSVLGR